MTSATPATAVTDRTPPPDEALNERRWSAMSAKSTEGIDPFVIAVRTTGIYCRVGCPARTPYRQNVHFFETTELAEDAGFRACKRCHPDEGDLSPWQPKSTWKPRAEQRTAS